MVRRSYLFSSVLAVRLDSAESHYLFALPAEKCSDVYPNKSSPLQILYGICPNKYSPAFALTNPLRRLSLGTPNLFCCSSQLWLPAEHTTDLKAVSTEYSFPRSLNSALTVLPLPVMSVVMSVATPSLWCLLLSPSCLLLPLSCLLLSLFLVCCYPLLSVAIPFLSVAIPPLYVAPLC